MREICRQIFLYLKGHRVTTLVILALGAPATQFIYQVGSDFVEGRWASGGVDLYLHTERLWRSEPVYLFYSSPDLVGKQRVIVPVELLINNDSDKAVKMVTLSLAYPSSADRQLLPESTQFQTGDLMDKDVIHEVRTHGGYAYSHYRMPFMPPRDTINFTDGAFAASLGGAGKSYQSYGSGLDLFATLSSKTSARET